MSAAVFDRRHELYLPRLAWLDENGFDDYDERKLLLDLWARLDVVRIRCVSERLASAIKESQKPKGSIPRRFAPRR